MKTIKTKVVAVVLVCVLLASGICGFTSIRESRKTSKEECNEILMLQTKQLTTTLNSSMSMISQSVDTLASMCLKQLDDIEYFQTSNDYVTRYTSMIAGSLQEAATNARGAINCYIRYNPEFTQPTSGIFLARNDTESEFKNVTPTDFSIYDKDDAEHVGWYYIPVENGKPTWMEPYMNENINTYIISYVVPLIVEDITIGIVGMDIDFLQVQDIVAQAKYFDSGYAFMTTSSGSILYHPNLEKGTDASKDTKYGMKEVAAFLKDSKKADTVQSYSVGGKKYDVTYTVLNNGLKVGSIVPENEVLQRSNSATKKIIAGTVLSLFLALLIGIAFSWYVMRPLKTITNVIKTIASLDFRPNPSIAALRKRRDETGDMATAIQEMQQHINELVQQIDTASDILQTNIRNLEKTTNNVDNLSVDNSAVSEELAASMQETSASSELITENVGDVTNVARSISDLSESSVASAKEIQNRAVALQEKTNYATNETNKMYEEVSRRSQEALLQAKAVDKINEMTRAITDISSQTNLLALNASIEAARAGDAGKGFAVVATEIGNLANQTLETVGNIDSIVGEVVKAVENMALCLQNSTDFLENTVLSDYKEFSKISEQYTDDARTFDNSMRQIQSAITELTESMNGIGKAIAEINSTIGDATSGVNNIAESSIMLKSGVSDNLEQVQTSIESIQNLKNVVAKFQI